MFGEAGRDAFRLDQTGESGGRLTEGGAVLILPGNKEGLGVAIQPETESAFAGHGTKSVSGIDILDPMDGGHFEPALPRIDEELKRSRAHHGMIGDDLGGLQVAFQAGILHELDVAEIGEALTGPTETLEASMPTSRSSPVRS